MSPVPLGRSKIEKAREILLLPMGYCESFNGKLRDELLSREIFYDLREAKALIEG